MDQGFYILCLIPAVITLCDIKLPMFNPLILLSVIARQYVAMGHKQVLVEEQDGLERLEDLAELETFEGL